MNKLITRFFVLTELRVVTERGLNGKFSATVLGSNLSRTTYSNVYIGPPRHDTEDAAYEEAIEWIYGAATVLSSATIDMGKFPEGGIFLTRGENNE